MNLQRARYFLSLYFLVFTCDAFYTLVILWGLELVFVLDGVLYGIVAAIIFVIIFFHICQNSLHHTNSLLTCIIFII